ncbi:hypothetical protein N665_0125s0018 [Sinapis alba]|nr:hypothetical protein N665_0125s0018 [Sinapis alba]
MATEDMQTPPCHLPERIFALGAEPTGVRVTPYHKADGIRIILNALDQEEVEKIRVSPFGKLIEIADKPTFSGRFGRYIISRQLKVSKKHEAWFLFAGKPIRFSLREFALVTGLNCRRLPKRCKKRSKNFITEKPYWGELFGTLKEVPVSSVVRMLKKKLCVSQKLGSRPRRDDKRLDAFFEFPWGRVSFDLLLSSIKERKEVSLSQNTIALKGFVLSLQLVIVESVPALTEVVQDGSSSGSDGECGDEDDISEGEKPGKKSISPGHARETDAAGKAIVQSIMVDVIGGSNDTEEYDWSDDEDDVGVTNMVKLIEQGFPFTQACFVGGASRQDVDNTGQPVTEAHNKTPLCTHEQQSCNVIANTNTDSEAHMAGARNNCLNNNGDQEDSDEDNVEASEEEAVDEESGEATDQVGVVDLNLESIVDEVTIGCRKSKRQKVPTKSLLSAYQCDHGFLNRARKAVAETIYNGGHIDYAAKFSLLLDKLKGSFCVSTERGKILSTEVHQIIERPTHLSPKVVNILISHIGTLFRSQPHPQQMNNCVFMDTQFVSQLNKMYTKFSKASKKDGFKFTASVVESIQQDPSKSEVGRFYFPFNLDQKYWVGICVDCISWSVTVLDCNTALRTDYLMNKEVRPIAQMFPYLLKQAGRQVGLRECKGMTIERPRTIPQQNQITDSGVATIIFIQAHAVGGVEVCKCITPDVLHTEVEQLVVSLYEANVGTL